MGLLMYAPPASLAGERLSKTICTQNDPDPWECFGTIETLAERLRRPLGKTMTAVLCPQDQMELEELITMRHLLRDMRIILILPDSKAGTVSNGHALRPRFVSYADSNFKDVAAVMAKITETITRKQSTCPGR